MTVQIETADGVTLAGGEAARTSPAHVRRMPAGNGYRVAAFTGTIGAALAANSELFQFRFVTGSKTKALVHHIGCAGVGIVAVATAIGPLGFAVFPARSWTVAGSGGTRILGSADNMTLETAASNSQVTDIGISTTGALTAGTKTLDANAIGMAITGTLTGAATVQQTGLLMPPCTLFSALEAGDMPLVLENNEGFAIRTTHAGPAALTYTVGFTVAWSEVAAF